MKFISSNDAYIIRGNIIYPFMVFFTAMYSQRTRACRMAVFQ
jgi:hypothetical protein